MATSKKNGKSTEELMAPLNALISKGRRDGMLSSSELMAALEKMDLSVDKIEQVYDTFESIGIQIVSGDTENDSDPMQGLLDDLDMTGAGFGAALAILLGAGYFGISMSAFVFGLLAVAAAYAVSCMSRTNQTIALILSGMMVSSLFSAGTSYLKLVADTQQQLPAITYWLMGSLSSIKPRDVLFLVIPVTLGLVPLLILSWRMNLLTLGEEEARSMGVNTRLLRFTVILCATLLTASSVAVSGMIGWVGLVIPHFCRMLFGYDYRRLIPAAALFGASFLIIVDDIARLATAGEIPLGILTAFVGAPIFLYLILTGGARRGN